MGGRTACQFGKASPHRSPGSDAPSSLAHAEGLVAGYPMERGMRRGVSSHIEHHPGSPAIPVSPTLQEVIGGRLDDAFEPVSGRVGRLSQQLSLYIPTLDLKHSDIGRGPPFHITPKEEFVQPGHKERGKISALGLNRNGLGRTRRSRLDHEGDHAPGGIGEQLKQAVGGGRDPHIRSHLERFEARVLHLFSCSLAALHLFPTCRTSHPALFLLISQCLDRVEEGRFARGVVAKEDSYEGGEGERHEDSVDADHRGPFGEVRDRG